MDISQLLQTLAILIEVSVTAIAVLIAIQNRKVYGWFIAGTFGLFIIFDIFRIFPLPISTDIHSLFFLIACTLMLCAVWLIYGEREV